MNIFNNISIRPRFLLLIFIAVATLVISSAYYELKESEKEMLQLMSNEAQSLLETVLVSSQEVLYASNEVEEEIQKRLLNNANIIKILLENKSINNTILERIATENEINRINIFNKNAEKIFSNNVKNQYKDVPAEYVKNNLLPIFNDESDTLIIGFKKSRAEQGVRYVVAIASNNNDAIVLNLDAEKLLEFKQRIGFGVLIKRLTENKGVIYAALENYEGILAASGLIENIDAINETPFLLNAINDSTYAWRITELDNEEYLEAVYPFTLEGNIIGLYRIGLSLEPLNLINKRLSRRIIVITIILFLFGSVMLTLLFVRQNLAIVKKQYQTIETYSNKLIKSVSDAIVVIDNKYQVKEINEAATILFGWQYENAIGSKICSILSDDNCNEIFSDITAMKQITCSIKGHQKHLLISKSTFIDEKEVENVVLIIKDLTEIKKLERQIARSEQMNAMGQLASGVAHEIRNPLNSIATIVQQLDKDFEPVENKDEYHSLAKIVYKEVRRMNNTIQNFLRFSKPEPVVKKRFQLSELIRSVEKQYKTLMKEKSIELIIEQKWDGMVNWDNDKIKQVLINLIQNSIVAIEKSGEVKIKTSKEKNNIVIEVSDTGSGIAKENIQRIFNLYYTTKATGTGIGLGIIQRIINEHDGTVTVKSEVNKGTSFIITIPQN
ncbi:MAG: ATP-binding protein [Melioribacteraceae bacterium]|nr:ATP-binding protein [Melioribacteraceae bacterium]